MKITRKTSYNTILAINERLRAQQQVPPPPLPPKNVSENQWTDSGIDSSVDYAKMRKHKSAMKISKSLSDPAYPCDVSFVGGVFCLKLFHHTINITSTSAEDQIQRLPLFAITMFQPNMLISQSAVDRTTQLSLFNFVLKFGVDKTPTLDNCDVADEFADTFFDTRQGDLDEYGVPPALFMYKEYITPAQEKNVVIHLRRPIQFNFSHKTFEKLLALSTIFNEFTTLRHSRNNQSDVPNCRQYARHSGLPESTPIVTSNKISIIQKNLFNANRVEISVADIEFNCSQSNVYHLKVGIRDIKAKVDIFDHPQKLMATVSADAFLVQMDRFIVLSPTSVSLSVSLVQENWKRMPMILFNLALECVGLSIGPTDITNALEIQQNFDKCWKSYQEQLKLIPLLHESADVVQDEAEQLLTKILTQIPTPKCSRSNVQTMDEFYQDDLR